MSAIAKKWLQGLFKLLLVKIKKKVKRKSTIIV